MKIKDAIEYYRNRAIASTPLLTLVEFAEKHAKKTGWINVYINLQTWGTWGSKHFESHSIATGQIIGPDKKTHKYIATVEVEYYPED